MRFDQNEYERLKSRDPYEFIGYSPHEQARVEETADKEIRSGRLRPEKRAHRIRELKREESREIMEFLAREEATKKHKFRGEPDVIRTLLALDTSPQQIRDLCAEAFMTIDMKVGDETLEVEVPAWPITAGSILPDYLSKHAEAFTAAKHNPRFPRCDVSRRPTTQWKQLWFLCRALAGSELGVSTRTAINLVGSLRPEEIFAESRDAKPSRRRRLRIMSKRRNA